MHPSLQAFDILLVQAANRFTQLTLRVRAQPGQVDGSRTHFRLHRFCNLRFDAVTDRGCFVVEFCFRLVSDCFCRITCF